ncbi:hypothetical protein ACFWYW_41715 [Nonomuraea sp. NPDC059023]|uniref:hypothetical protein n=1 Tax=unclassified Nonomuraea TaxID=2593643 RepID=UPI0036A5FBF3
MIDQAEVAEMTEVRTSAKRIEEQDWRFAELVMRTWSEPRLAGRYLADPVGTFADFGIVITNAADAPQLGGRPLNEAAVTIQNLDRPGANVPAWPSGRA